MCGRFTLKTPPVQWNQLLLPNCDFAAVTEDWQPRYNIAPTQPIIAVAARDALASQSMLPASTADATATGYVGREFRWGLVPFWADDLKIGNRMINARAETLTEKRSFANPLKKRRCLILADGYYEWQKRAEGGKQPYWIHHPQESLLLMAGLWEVNRKATDHVVPSCTIITVAANHQLQQIHDRSPAILSPESAVEWISSETTAERAAALLKPVPDDLLTPRPVSTRVNNPRNEDPECLGETTA